MTRDAEETPEITVIGLGPAGLDRLQPDALALLSDPARTVVVRTIEHPAGVELSGRRDVIFCDDVYETAETFDAVYATIAARILSIAESGPVVYAVPGSAVVGERSVRLLQDRAPRGVVSVIPGESFLDLACLRSEVDPIADGLQVVDGRDLPDPLALHLPTFITQVDSTLVLADVAAVLGRYLVADEPVGVLDRLGSTDEVVTKVPLQRLTAIEAGPRLTLHIPATETGWHGLVATNRRLRRECPWDAKQTHHTLVRHLIEEAYETVDAIGALPVTAPRGDPDPGAYAHLEEELGDLLLQILFHATLAAEAGAFDVDEVAEGIRRKLVRRHPHVYGDVQVDGADEVLANWEVLKQTEKERESLMDDIPIALPGIARADKIQRRAATAGFDWSTADPVFAKVEEELTELRAATGPDHQTSEVGDLLFAVVNLARHLHVDPETALARANDRFVERFRLVETRAGERDGGIGTLNLDQMNELWEEAKRDLA